VCSSDLQKPVKIKAGLYRYQGVSIRKSERLGFVYTVHPSNPYGTWWYGGQGTLAKAVAEIDAQLASGDYVVRNAHVKQLVK